MKSNIAVIFFAFVAGLAGAAVFSVVSPKTEIAVVKQETAYERVMRTKTLRCGYVVDPPHLVKEAATGTFSGPIHDVVNEAGRLLGLKVEWAEELTWGNMVEAMHSRRVDALCTDFWENPVNGAYVGFGKPLYYSAVYPYVRADDTRFDHKLDAINDPAITIITLDGEMSGMIAQQDYPNAKLLSVSTLTSAAENLVSVSMKKADVVFTDPIVAFGYMKNNPDKIKQVLVDRPVRTFPVTIALPMGDVALKTMLDSAFTQMLSAGFVEKSLTKNGLPPNVVYRAAAPYAVPAEAGVN